MITRVDIISRWEVLENLARDRQVQSRDLASIYADVLSIKSTIEDSTAVLNHNCYEDILDLENTIKQIQVCLIRITKVTTTNYTRSYPFDVCNFTNNFSVV